MQFNNPKIYHTYKKIEQLAGVNANYLCDDGIKITFDTTKQEMQKIHELAIELKPWRKGPFFINELFIDSEWRSFIKWNQIAPYVDLKDKDVADIGCNNGYYLFEMLKQKPRNLIGFDPSELFFTQFSFINHFIKASIIYELLGVDDLKDYGRKFDVIFCLGVLYHRSDPIKALKSLSQSLKDGGEIILDTLIIENDLEVSLTPKTSYAKMNNVYFIPSIAALRAWCFRANLELAEILSIKETTIQEQRKTSWIDTLSLDSFLNTEGNLTIEGYPPPKRGYFKLKRKVKGD